MSDNDKNINISPVPKFMDNALTKITDKPSEQLGNSFSDLFYLVFGGIGQAAAKRKMRYAVELEKYSQELNAKILDIPEEKRIEPDIQVVAPALEASKYCVEKEEIRTLFVNLISSSMNEDKKEFVHPLFTHIIERMSSYEARLFRFLASKSEPAHDSSETDNLLPTDIEHLSFSLAILKQFGLIKEISSSKRNKEASSSNKNNFESFYINKSDINRKTHNFYSELFINYTQFGPVVNIVYDTVFELLTKYLKEHSSGSLPKHKIIYEFLKSSFVLTSVGEVFRDICL